MLMSSLFAQILTIWCWSMLTALQDGIWTLGMIRGSAADMAGLKQGDQLLAVDSKQLDGQTPFQVATLISGGDDDTDAKPYVTLQARALACWRL